jgi:hypothetical protein
MTLQVSLVEMPRFSFGITLYEYLNLMVLPGLEAFVHYFISDILLRPYVLPESISIPLTVSWHIEPAYVPAITCPALHRQHSAAACTLCTAERHYSFTPRPCVSATNICGKCSINNPLARPDVHSSCASFSAKLSCATLGCSSLRSDGVKHHNRPSHDTH